MNNRLGSLIVSIFKVMMLGILALYAKRSAFFRPFYWFVVQLGAVFAGLAVTIALMSIFALLGWYGSTFAEVVGIGVWLLIAIGSIAEFHQTMEQIELELFGNITYLAPVQKVLGFIYGALLHVWLFNEVIL